VLRRREQAYRQSAVDRRIERPAGRGTEPLRQSSRLRGRTRLRVRRRGKPAARTLAAL